jgi:hypothetical protein
MDRASGGQSGPGLACAQATSGNFVRPDASQLIFGQARKWPISTSVGGGVRCRFEGHPVKQLVLEAFVAGTVAIACPVIVALANNAVTSSSLAGNALTPTAAGQNHAAVAKAVTGKTLRAIRLPSAERVSLR